ncbi:MAG: agmatine deiminase family protein, partial [Verrucomicrobiae bacterium]|nr:agmatine deiminase family protein [Verrucomicrobiae bacterium]
AGPGTIVTAIEEDPSDPNHAPLAENLARLEAMRSPEGVPFRVVTIPMPGAVMQKGQRLPASYLNFYIANAAVIVPTYRHPNDAVALDRLREVFTDRPVVGLDATDMIWGLGSFHCITQQEPA